MSEGAADDSTLAEVIAINAERTRCPVCRYTVRVNEGGKIARHRAYSGGKSHKCEGSGKNSPKKRASPKPRVSREKHDHDPEDHDSGG